MTCCSGCLRTAARGTGRRASAAHGGQLELLQWARANGCPWDGKTCAHAAKGGQIEVLK